MSNTQLALLLYWWSSVMFVSGACVANMGFHESWWEILFDLAIAPLVPPFILIVEITEWWQRRRRSR